MSLVQMRAISSIVIDADLSMAMPVNPKVVAKLEVSMKMYGFLVEHPIIVWFYCGLYYLIDGRNRLQACILNKIGEVPVVTKNFSSWAEARAYVIKCQVDRRGMDDAVILSYLLHVQLYGRGGYRAPKVKGPTEPLSGCDLEKEVSLQEIATELSVSLRRVKRVKRNYYDPLPGEKRALVRSGKISVYDFFPDEDKGDGLDGAQSLATDSLHAGNEQASRTARRKAGDIILQKLALTDEEISTFQDKLRCQRATVKDYLTRLIRRDLGGAVEPEANAKTTADPVGQPLIDSTGSDAKILSSRKHKAAGYTVDTVRITRALSNVSSDPSHAERKPKTWNGWNNETLTALGCFLNLAESRGKTNLELSAEFALRWNALAKSNFTPKAIEHKLVAARDLVAQAAIVDFPDRLASLEKQARAAASSV